MQVDARGFACPKPVILTKKAIDQGENHITTIVDNEVAKENVTKLIKKMNFDYNVEVSEGNYYINFDTNCEVMVEEGLSPKEELDDLVILVASDKFGNGIDELGKVLMKGFLYTLTERTPYPKSVIFVNGGVLNTVEGSPSIDNLKILQEKGVEILSCGTCLDYYNVKNKLMVGEISNMYTIVDTLNSAKNTIRI
jgi:selenium metabolism protein YedF